MLRSFIDTQRHSTAESIRKAFKYDLLVYDWYFAAYRLDISQYKYLNELFEWIIVEHE